MFVLDNHRTFSRPQALVFSDRKFSYSESNQQYLAPTDLDESKDEAIVLPDHSRAPISLGRNRIESRNRMINGRSRSYWTADKLTLSTSWENLPSRLASGGMDWIDGMQIPVGTMYLADNAAPAILISQWYENHPEPFYVYMSYDDAYRGSVLPATPLNRYVREVKMYFTSFSMTLNKRGAYDFWNVDMALEEV